MGIDSKNAENPMISPTPRETLAALALALAILIGTAAVIGSSPLLNGGSHAEER